MLTSPFHCPFRSYPPFLAQPSSAVAAGPSSVGVLPSSEWSPVADNVLAVVYQYPLAPLEGTVAHTVVSCHYTTPSSISKLVAKISVELVVVATQLLVAPVDVRRVAYLLVAFVALLAFELDPCEPVVACFDHREI